MAMPKFDKGLLAIGAGAGLGVILSPVLGKFLPANYQTIPGLTFIPAPWNQTKILVPIIVGATAFSIAQFTKVIKKDEIKDMIWVFGVTSLISGVVNGAINGTSAGLRARTMNTVRRPVMSMAPRAAPVAATPVTTGVTNTIINS